MLSTCIKVNLIKFLSESLKSCIMEVDMRKVVVYKRKSLI